jgi:hypothetical protein
MRVIEDTCYGEVAGMPECKYALTRKRDSQLSIENMTAKPPSQRKAKFDCDVIISGLPFRAFDYCAM